jgi:hypothetical protein
MILLDTHIWRMAFLGGLRHLALVVSPRPGLQPGEQLQGAGNIPLMQGDLRERTEAFAPLQDLSRNR